MRVATTIEDFAEYLGSDIFSILSALKESGCKYVDFSFYPFNKPDSPFMSDNWRDFALSVAQKANELGLTFVQAHGTDSCWEEGEERERRNAIIARELEFCKILGIPALVVHGIARASGEREEFMQKNTELYRQLLKYAEATGVTICTENTCRSNNPTYYIFEGEDANELCSRVNHELFGVCWDIGHAHAHGVDQYKAIKAMAGNLKAIHVHDNNREINFERDLHLQPYCGNVCFDAVVKGLVDIDFKGFFTLESHCMPVPASFCFCNRKPYELDGEVYDRLLMPPLDIKIRSERLMLDTARFMLEAYDCYQD